jgi:hypothetical protein
LRVRRRKARLFSVLCATGSPSRPVGCILWLPCPL